MALRELGFRALKLFPAEAAGGAKLLASLAAPLPDLRFCPTGGIDLAKAPDYLQAAQRSLRRGVVDVAEGGDCGGRLFCGRGLVARGGGLEASRCLKRGARGVCAALASLGRRSKIVRADAVYDFARDSIFSVA